MSGTRANTWMPLYIGDYLADTMHLNTGEHGAYLLLIMSYWRSGTPLPDDDKSLAGICKATTRQWKEMKPALGAFFSVEDGVWRHKRIDAELEKAGNISATRRDVGARGGAAKWGASQAAASRSQRLAAARAKGTHTKIEWAAMLEVFGQQCVRCGIHADEARGGICKDHITPIYQGGSDAIWNLQPLCSSCNSSKGPDTTDLRQTACHDWQERLAKCLANASQTPGQSQSQSQEEREAIASPKMKGQQNGTRIPDDWEPDEQDREFARSIGVEADDVAATFRDYWRSKPGAGGRKLDWSATWRNWCRKSAEQSNSRSGRMVHRQKPNSLIAAASAVLAQIEGEQ
jgi:uncharacterized protein YdaU (DUF1376 family)